MTCSSSDRSVGQDAESSQGSCESEGLRPRHEHRLWEGAQESNDGEPRRPRRVLSSALRVSEGSVPMAFSPLAVFLLAIALAIGSFVAGPLVSNSRYGRPARTPSSPERMPIPIDNGAVSISLVKFRHVHTDI